MVTLLLCKNEYNSDMNYHIIHFIEVPECTLCICEILNLDKSTHETVIICYQNTSCFCKLTKIVKLSLTGLPTNDGSFPVTSPTWLEMTRDPVVRPELKSKVWHMLNSHQLHNILVLAETNAIHHKPLDWCQKIFQIFEIYISNWQICTCSVQKEIRLLLNALCSNGVKQNYTIRLS